MAAVSENITNHILAQATAQAQEILDSANTQAEEGVALAVSQAEERAKTLLEKAEKDAVEIAVRALSAADLKVRKHLLAQKRTLLDEVFQRAEQRFFAYENAEYTEAYVKLVLGALQKGDEGIAVAKEDAQRLGEGFVSAVNKGLVAKGMPANVHLLPPRDGILGGCVVISGGMEVDLSTRSVFKAVREQCEGEVAQTLFAHLEG